MLRKVFGSFALFLFWIFVSAIAYLLYYYVFGSLLMGIGTSNEYVQVVYEFVFENSYTDIANIVISLFLGGVYCYVNWNED